MASWGGCDDAPFPTLPQSSLLLGAHALVHARVSLLQCGHEQVPSPAVDHVPDCPGYGVVDRSFETPQNFRQSPHILRQSGRRGFISPSLCANSKRMDELYAFAEEHDGLLASKDAYAQRNQDFILV